MEIRPWQWAPNWLLLGLANQWGMVWLNMGHFNLLVVLLIAIWWQIASRVAPSWRPHPLALTLFILLILIPTTLMGSSLPLLARHFVRADQDARRLGHRGFSLHPALERVQFRPAPDGVDRGGRHLGPLRAGSRHRRRAPALAVPHGPRPPSAAGADGVLLAQPLRHRLREGRHRFRRPAGGEDDGAQAGDAARPRRPPRVGTNWIWSSWCSAPVAWCWGCSSVSSPSRW